MQKSFGTLPSLPVSSPLNMKTWLSFVSWVPFMTAKECALCSLILNCFGQVIRTIGTVYASPTERPHLIVMSTADAL